MKNIILLTMLMLSFFFESNAQNNSIKSKDYRKRDIQVTTPVTKKPRYSKDDRIPRNLPPGTPNNQVIVKNDTVQNLVYKIFYNTTTAAQYRKGILVMGSGNNESNPSVGSLAGASENALCTLAVNNGYVAAIVQYSKGPGISNWNASAQQIAGDYDKCITDISNKYSIPKSKTVIGGVSYAAFLLLTVNGYYNTLAYCKGLLAPCSATSTNAASSFKIPVYNICCSGGNETGDGNENGQTLYNAINANVKSKSECIIDNSCNTHCGGNWTIQLFQKMQYWLQ